MEINQKKFVLPLYKGPVSLAYQRMVVAPSGKQDQKAPAEEYIAVPVFFAPASSNQVPVMKTPSTTESKQYGAVNEGQGRYRKILPAPTKVCDTTQVLVAPNSMSSQKPAFFIPQVSASQSNTSGSLPDNSIGKRSVPPNTPLQTSAESPISRRSTGFINGGPTSTGSSDTEVYQPRVTLTGTADQHKGVQSQNKKIGMSGKITGGAWVPTSGIDQHESGKQVKWQTIAVKSEVNWQINGEVNWQPISSNHGQGSVKYQANQEPSPTNDQGCVESQGDSQLAPTNNQQGSVESQGDWQMAPTNDQGSVESQAEWQATSINDRHGSVVPQANFQAASIQDQKVDWLVGSPNNRYDSSEQVDWQALLTHGHLGSTEQQDDGSSTAKWQECGEIVYHPSNQPSSSTEMPSNQILGDDFDLSCIPTDFDQFLEFICQSPVDSSATSSNHSSRPQDDAQPMLPPYPGKMKGNKKMMSARVKGKPYSYPPLPRDINNNDPSMRVNGQHLDINNAANDGKAECGYCKKRFKDLRRHMKSCGPESKRRCPICHIFFPSVPSMKNHMKTHSVVVPPLQSLFECPICDRNFNSSSERASHIKRAHLMHIKQKEMTRKGLQTMN